MSSTTEITKESIIGLLEFAARLTGTIGDALAQLHDGGEALVNFPDDESFAWKMQRLNSEGWELFRALKSIAIESVATNG